NADGGVTGGGKGGGGGLGGSGGVTGGKGVTPPPPPPPPLAHPPTATAASEARRAARTAVGIILAFRRPSTAHSKLGRTCPSPRTDSTGDGASKEEWHGIEGGFDPVEQQVVFLDRHGV